ncbi:MAG: hypothetical protein R3Y43_01445 [Alphaproteobacteria bacterium]
MSKIIVKDKVVCLGVGMVLELSESQALARQNCLTKKDEYYVVNSPVYFKKGEEFAIISGKVPKKLLSNIEDTKNDGNKTPPNTDNGTQTPEFPCMKHMGFGRYDVFNADGEKVNETQLTKANAEELLKTLEEATEDEL